MLNPTLNMPEPNRTSSTGQNSLGFYWDSVFERTADTLQHAEVGIDPAKFDEAISSSNISRTWANLKQQFPLLGAQIEERDANSVFFQCRPGEITFQDITSSQEALDIANKMIAKDRLLTNDLLARIFILRRTDAPNLFHLLIHVAHSITDGMSNITIMKTFLDQIFWDITQQLALSESSENFLAKRRWRRALRLTGGHTLPRKVSQKTAYTPADSKSLGCIFSLETSKLIISNCRKNQLTFGNTYPILGQIALTRLLLRRYLRGDMNEEEWEFRKREPMSSAGPLNLRPFLHEEWIAAGGSTMVERVRGVGLQWRNEKGPPKDFSEKPFSPVEQAAAGLVFCNGGSSMGNVGFNKSILNESLTFSLID
ncbi:hypothetical protein BDZ97DRAFT_1812891 [Flammula alnicola]|nr:hypothetical protein BDZ97DRAFT_1812891 [Flammula alnicola]